MIVRFVCLEDVRHNGVQYRKGQHWDQDLPAPEVGACWSISQYREPPPGPQIDSICTGSSIGYVGWVPQPGRPVPVPLTDAEKARLEIDPYDPLDDAPPPPPPVPEPGPAEAAADQLAALHSPEAVFARQQKNRELAALDDLAANQLKAAHSPEAVFARQQKTLALTAADDKAALEEADRERAEKIVELDAKEEDPPADPVVLDPPPEQLKPIMPSHLQMTQAEIADPYGIKARAAEHTAELQAELDAGDLPDGPQLKK